MSTFDKINKPLIHAHRGFSKIAPENTIVAMKAAMDIGADAIEIDIRKTKDNIVIVSHDDKINRCSDGEGIISELTLNELEKYDFGYQKAFGDKYKDVKIPTFEEVLVLLEKNKNWNGFLNIEFKTADDTVDKAICIIKKHKLENRTMFCSFHYEALVKAKSLAGQIKCGFLNSEVDCHIANNFSDLKKYGIEYLHPHYAKVTKEIVDVYAESKVGLNVWTVDNIDDINYQLEIGVNSIITNTPDLAIQLRNKL